ncbi:hypothetical protein [Methylosinus sp. Ce-a6]|uniref:hypothetical protein n=1 Tax=Methylosinus sp. Ce-a6 TaxID=2172005 RepID=UPI00135AD4F8|nr:hypothetical protein [Methylosinus sp. Ce-a6]
MFSSEFSTDFQRLVLPRLAIPLLGGLLLAAAQGGARAVEAPRNVYLISGHEGYGVVECITQKKGCGKIVADSWCESHGHGPAVAYGRADDVTSAIGPASARRPATAEAAVVSCND